MGMRHRLSGLFFPATKPCRNSQLVRICHLERQREILHSATYEERFLALAVEMQPRTQAVKDQAGAAIGRFERIERMS